ncbi:UNVERIFIED_CONTAM: hypothetical protein Slati_0144100 [Sesamum latifolium]|uniref:Uncharacterized protein n=1 Tax=Sesamum latifolium TaxID=2727402 RepID=A0AAW2Y9W3_9LAMI
MKLVVAKLVNASKPTEACSLTKLVKAIPVEVLKLVEACSSTNLVEVKLLKADRGVLLNLAHRGLKAGRGVCFGQSGQDATSKPVEACFSTKLVRDPSPEPR